MAFIRKMELSDAKQTSKMTKEIMLDCWEKYEKDYYPKKGVRLRHIRTLAEILSRFT